MHTCTPVILHRDIRGNNVLLTEDGRAKLTDFGLSRTLREEACEHKSISANSWSWLAPETWQDISSPQTDIYALGMTLLEMTIGKDPYQGQTSAQIYQLRVVEKKLPEYPAHDSLKNLFLKCCAFATEERVQTAADIAKVLQ